MENIKIIILLKSEFIHLNKFQKQKIKMDIIQFQKRKMRYFFIMIIKDHIIFHMVIIKKNRHLKLHIIKRLQQVMIQVDIFMSMNNLLHQIIIIFIYIFHIYIKVVIIIIIIFILIL